MALADVDLRPEGVSTLKERSPGSPVWKPGARGGQDGGGRGGLTPSPARCEALPPGLLPAMDQRFVCIASFWRGHGRLLNAIIGAGAASPAGGVATKEIWWLSR